MIIINAFLATIGVILALFVSILFIGAIGRAIKKSEALEKFTKDDFMSILREWKGDEEFEVYSLGLKVLKHDDWKRELKRHFKLEIKKKYRISKDPEKLIDISEKFVLIPKQIAEK